MQCLQRDGFTLRASYVIRGHADGAAQEKQTAMPLCLGATMSPFGMLKTGTVCFVGSSLLAAEPMLPHSMESCLPGGFDFALRSRRQTDSASA